MPRNESGNPAGWTNQGTTSRCAMRGLSRHATEGRAGDMPHAAREARHHQLAYGRRPRLMARSTRGARRGGPVACRPPSGLVGEQPRYAVVRVLDPVFRSPARAALRLHSRRSVERFCTNSAGIPVPPPPQKCDLASMARATHTAVSCDRTRCAVNRVRRRNFTHRGKPCAIPSDAQACVPTEAVGPFAFAGLVRVDLGSVQSGSRENRYARLPSLPVTNMTISTRRMSPPRPPPTAGPPR
jgi:hypothetical protein